jgi:chromosome segregation ATPase
VRCAGYALKTQDCTGVWVKRQTIDACVDIWMEEHLKDWADARDAIRGADDERAQLTNEITEARAELEQFETGRRNALNLVGRGLATQDEYEAMLAENQRSGTQRLAESTNSSSGSMPSIPMPTSWNAWATTTSKPSPEEMNMLLKRILRKVSVTKQEITITPWRGDAWVWNRISGDWTA